MKTIEEIKQLSENFANAMNDLEQIRTEIKEEIKPIEIKQGPRLNLAAERAANAEALLHEAIAESKELFQDKKSNTYFGIKAGVQKQKDTLAIVDQDETIKLIREFYPEKASAFIKTEETIIQEPVKKLKEEELKKIGVELVKGEEEVLIKVEDSAVSKVIKSVLKESSLKEAA